MKKSIIAVVALMCAVSMLFAAPKAKKSKKAASGPIRIGIINNPPSESGYRAANVKDMEEVFSAAKGYEVKSF